MATKGCSIKLKNTRTRFGLRAFMAGKWYDVELAERFLQDVRGDYMPIVEKDLIARFLLKDLRADYA